MLVLNSPTNQNQLMMSLLDKDTLKTEILPFLPRPKRGESCSETLLLAILALILYRLKTGCQWRELPISRYISGKYSYKSVFYHFSRWSKLDIWQDIWLHLLRAHRDKLNLHTLQLDGTHTRTRGAIEKSAFQRRKGGKTSNLRCLCDEKGVLLAFSAVQAGNHHDLYDIVAQFEQMLAQLTAIGIRLEGLILNADAGFDSLELRNLCEQYGLEVNIKLNPRNGKIEDRNEYFDPQFYQHRLVIERTFGELDGFKALVIRYDKTACNWLNFNILGFIIKTIKKFK